MAINPIRVSPSLAIARQPRVEDFATLAALGYRAVINTRPEGEPGEAYPSAAEAAAAAAAHGLRYVHLPVTGADATEPESIAAFAALLEELPKPVVAHCKSGMRSVILWAFNAVRERPVDEVLAAAARCGFDLGLLREELAEQAARRPPRAPSVAALRCAEALSISR